MNAIEHKLLQPMKPMGFTPTCSDLEHECPDVPDKVACYLYEPQRGMCPYLRTPPKTPAATEGETP